MATNILLSPMPRFAWPRMALRSALRTLERWPLLSVVLSVVSFSFFGPLAALVLVATMLDHEFAHRVLMRRLGYDPGPVRLIPFVGAFVRARRPMLRSADIALIYLAGPVVGVLSAALAALLASHLLSPALCRQVYVGAAASIALNVFNLIPIEPLDGGLISRALPYPALLLFPSLLTLWLLHTGAALTPLGLVIVFGAAWITLRKVSKWRRYVANLHLRLAASDLAALRELRATSEVPLIERMLVVGAYVILVPGALALLSLLGYAGGWLH